MDEILKVKSFLENNRLASLATLTGIKKTPHIAVIYYVYEHGALFFATEKSSQKAKNILRNKTIALAIVQEKGLEMLQIEGRGEILEDKEERTTIIQKIYDRLDTNDVHEPWPLMKLHPKNLEIFEISIERFKYSNFAKDAFVKEGKGNELTNPYRTQDASRDMTDPHRPRFFPHLRRK